MTEELKPCPFCGGSNVSTYEVKGSYSTLCVGCGGEGPEEDSEAEAIAAWNRRSPVAATE
jgi:Lar family restriction alleviation protein